jgi:aminomethyltransferase
VPRLDDFWPLLDEGGAQVGVVRWAVWSYALETSIAIALADAAATGPLTVRAPDGDRRADRHPIPFV